MLTLLGFFMESVLLSVLSVLAALGEVRPLERRSSLVGEALPSGLAVCFLRPLRSVDICNGKQNRVINQGFNVGRAEEVAIQKPEPK